MVLEFESQTKSNSFDLSKKDNPVYAYRMQCIIYRKDATL